jgi:predicted GNAT superfamily acetyltransferase
MLGVTKGARDAGVGLRLKLAQRDRALAMGIDLIEWTYDPLQALNAHLNFTRLGVVVEEYEENIYGVSSSPLHSGSPTDRFVAEWKLTAPHVARRIAASGVGVIRDASISRAPLVNPSREQAPWLAPGPADLTLDAPRVLVEIPVDYSSLQLENPALALEWRLSTRAIFQHYLARGRRVVDFFLSREAGRGHYLLAAGS